MKIKTVTDIITECGGAAVVSEALGMSLYTICDWMTRNKLPPKHWKKLVDTFGININDLLNLTPSK